MYANGYLSPRFEVREVVPKLIMASPGSQTLALVRIPAVASMRGQGDDLIILPLRNLLERALQKGRVITSSDREDNGSKYVDFELIVSLPRYQVSKLLKAVNQIVIPRTGAMRIFQTDKQLA
jgi:hypothetical protein